MFASCFLYCLHKNHVKRHINEIRQNAQKEYTIFVHIDHEYECI